MVKKYQQKSFRWVSGKLQTRWEPPSEGWFETKGEAAAARDAARAALYATPEPKVAESEPEVVEKPAEAESLAQKFAPHHPPKKPRGRPRKHF